MVIDWRASPAHRSMKLVPVLLPFAGIAIAGTWWWGGSSSTPSVPEPLRPPVEGAPERADPPAATESRTGGTESEPGMAEPVRKDVAAEASPGGESCGEEPLPRRTGPSGTQDLELRDTGRLLHRLRTEGTRHRESGGEPKKLQLVQRLENGASVFALEESDRQLPEDGPVSLLHENGSKASTGSMRNDKKVGLWLEWYAAGHKSSEGNYFHGTRHGFWSYWYENGQLREAGEYLYGRKEGLWTSWHENGQKERVAYYRNDRAEDRTTIWHPDGTKAAEGRHEDDLREGFWLEWHARGALASRGSYHHGRAEGRWEFWDQEGVLDLGSTGLYREGRRIGE